MSSRTDKADDPFQTRSHPHVAAATCTAGRSGAQPTQSSPTGEDKYSGCDDPTVTRYDIGPPALLNYEVLDRSTQAAARSAPSRVSVAPVKHSQSYGAAAAAAAAVLGDARAPLQHGRSVLPLVTARVHCPGEGTDSPFGPVGGRKVLDELHCLEATYREEVETAIQLTNGSVSAAAATRNLQNSPLQTESDLLDDGDADSTDEIDYVDLRGPNEFGRLEPTFLEEVTEWRTTGRLPCPTCRDIATRDSELEHLPQSAAGPLPTVERRPCSQAFDTYDCPEHLCRAREHMQKASRVEMLTGSGSEDAPHTSPPPNDPVQHSDCRVDDDLSSGHPLEDVDISARYRESRAGRPVIAGESVLTHAEILEPPSPSSSYTQPGAYSEVQSSHDQALTSDTLSEFHENESGRPPLDLEDPVEYTNPDDVEFQRKIRQIVNHPTMSDHEKNVRRQSLFAENYNRSRTAAAVVARHRVVAQAREKSFSSVADPVTGELLLGCQHYPRNCKIQAKCCGLWCVCRLCHDSQDMALAHTINRKETERIMCMFCRTEQPVSNQCISCKEIFARYFCSICVFYDNTPDKDVYHCSDCGICRVGKGLGIDNFHCNTCNACVSIESRDNHKCIPKSLDANCPICSVYLFTSTDPVVFMRCGHTMHSHCFDEYTRKNYTCPLCCKALTDMSGYYKQIDRILQIDRMPPEYENHFSDIVCYDCSHKSRAKYHFVYHKCGDCGGYNTRVLQSVVVNAEGSEAGGTPQTVERQFRETRRVATSGRHPPILPAERDHPSLQRISEAPVVDAENASGDDFVMYSSMEGDADADADGGQLNGVVLNPG